VAGLLLQVAELADAAHGFVAADLAALCSEAALIALRRTVAAGSGGAACITLADFRAAETLTRPSAMRELAFEVPKVGGAAGLVGHQFLASAPHVPVCWTFCEPHSDSTLLTAGFLG
jgi:hypothetical protein